MSNYITAWAARTPSGHLVWEWRCQDFDSEHARWQALQDVEDYNRNHDGPQATLWYLGPFDRWAPEKYEGCIVWKGRVKA